jgi:hypothetical protein
MTNGPPPSQAGPSQPSDTAARQPAPIVPIPASSTTSQQTTTTGSSSQLQVQPVQYGPVTQGQNPQGYYAMSYTPGGWQNAWQVPSYPYIASGSAPGQQTHYAQVPYAQYQPPAVTYQAAPRQRNKVAQKPRSPTPEPELHRHWDEVIRSFLKKVGMNQALKGFEDDMVVMNADWERQKVPGAIGDLMKDLMVCASSLCCATYRTIFLLRTWGKRRAAKHPRNDHWRSESSIMFISLAVPSPSLRRR